MMKIFISIFFILPIFKCETSYEDYENIEKVCGQKTFCDINYKCNSNAKYRNIDGSCNNLIKPWIGTAFTPYQRLLEPQYDNMKIGTPRSRSVNNKDNYLPSPRNISFVVHTPLERQSEITEIAVFLGQFIAHDVGNAGPCKDSKGDDLKCNKLRDVKNPNCMLIELADNDILSKIEPFIMTPRTAFTNINWMCKKNVREQLNEMTHWLDLSGVYGTSNKQCDDLRVKRNGLLKTSKICGFKNTFLPIHVTKNEKNKNSNFHTGDPKINENMLLNSITTLFNRQHNNIARELKSHAPHWNDEKLFQEARRILIAQYQHIIYTEWLPIVLGDDIMKKYYLKSDDEYEYNYDPTLSAQVFNEFSTAALRFGHSMVKSIYYKKDECFNTISTTSLSNLLINTTEAFKNGGLDSLCRGIITELGSRCDRHFTYVIHNKLFENKKSIVKSLSLDTLNIARGRDHGFPSYTRYREYMNLEKVYTFADLNDFMPEDGVLSLSSVYDKVEDIDLYTSGILEYPVKGGLVGPSFANIIGQQFHNFKYGDRFFYENTQNLRNAFNCEQLNEIRKMTMARLICDTLSVHKIQPNPFYPQKKCHNRMVYCSKIPKINYKVFNLN